MPATDLRVTFTVTGAHMWTENGANTTMSVETCMISEYVLPTESNTLRDFTDISFDHLHI